MPKSQYIDPKEMRKAGEITFTPIPVNQYKKTIKEELKDILALELKLPAVDLIRCGGGDLMAAQREQWNDGSNTLCIAPGRVITYERNYVTNDLLAKHGLDVLTVPSAELSRGRGGPRCMSMPFWREDL